MPDTFHPFPRLPSELRRKIWSAHLRQPREIEVILLITESSDAESVDEEFVSRFHCATVPTLLSVNRESRCVSLKFYGSLSSMRCHYVDHVDNQRSAGERYPTREMALTREKGIFINPDYDLIVHPKEWYLKARRMWLISYYRDSNCPFLLKGSYYFCYWGHPCHGAHPCHVRLDLSHNDVAHYDLTSNVDARTICTFGIKQTLQVWVWVLAVDTSKSMTDQPPIDTNAVLGNIIAAFKRLEETSGPLVTEQISLYNGETGELYSRRLKGTHSWVTGG